MEGFCREVSCLLSLLIFHCCKEMMAIIKWRERENCLNGFCYFFGFKITSWEEVITLHENICDFVILIIISLWQALLLLALNQIGAVWLYHFFAPILTICSCCFLRYCTTTFTKSVLLLTYPLNWNYCSDWNDSECYVLWILM